MEMSPIEQYALDRIKELTQENIELKAKLLAKEKESDLTIKSVTKSGYSIYCWTYGVEQKLEQYELALKEKDFDWLQNNDFKIICTTWTYEIEIDGFTFGLYLYGSDGKPKLQLVEKPPFDTVEQARTALLIKLSKEIEKTKKTLKEKESDE